MSLGLAEREHPIFLWNASSKRVRVALEKGPTDTRNREPASKTFLIFASFAKSFGASPKILLLSILHGLTGRSFHRHVGTMRALEQRRYRAGRRQRAIWFHGAALEGSVQQGVKVNLHGSQPRLAERPPWPQSELRRRPRGDRTGHADRQERRCQAPGSRRRATGVLGLHGPGRGGPHARRRVPELGAWNVSQGLRDASELNARCVLWETLRLA